MRRGRPSSLTLKKSVRRRLRGLAKKGVANPKQRAAQRARQRVRRRRKKR